MRPSRLLYITYIPSAYIRDWIPSVRVVTSSEDGKHFTKAIPSFIFPRMLQWHLASLIYTPITPSSLHFLNEPDPIHCVKIISWSVSAAPRLDIMVPHPSRLGDILKERRTNSRFFMLTPLLSPSAQGLSHRMHSLSDKVWRGADYTCQWKESWRGGKWGLMENTENRNERNPLPLLLLARSDSFFPPLISFILLPLSTTPPHTGPSPVRQIKSPELFSWWILSFYWPRRWFFFFFF